MITDDVDSGDNAVSMVEDTLSADEMLSAVEDETLSAIGDETLSATEDGTLSAIEDDAPNPAGLVTETNESSTEGKLIFCYICLHTLYGRYQKEESYM